LIGMHVVFSAKGHPEMLWGTFEHVNNTRNPGYLYTVKDVGPRRRYPAHTAGKWVLSANSTVGPFNDARMHLEKTTGNIVAYDRKTIGPSNVLRESPWGGQPGNARDNTQIISINKQARHLLDRLARDDVRKNYLMIGTTWTNMGQPPNRS